MGKFIIALKETLDPVLCEDLFDSFEDAQNLINEANDPDLFCVVEI